MKQIIANWGNYPKTDSEVKSFSFTEQLEELITATDHFIPRGNGRCYGDASLAFKTISTLQYNRMLHFDKENGIFECQSGLTLDKILEVIVPEGWFLPVTPGTKFITIGGAVGSDVHGKNHHVDGSFSNHVMEMDVMIADGRTLTCSRGENTDLFDATCGGMGLTGMIIRVKFTLKKIETSYIKQKQIKAKNLEELIGLFEKYKDFTYSMAWIDCLTKGERFGRGILIIGEHAKRNELNKAQHKKPLVYSGKPKISFPFNLPSWMLNTLTVKIFNFLYYGKNLKKQINNVVAYEPFFYPLDAILNWNRGYGKKGFVQYQFVLPLASKQGLIDILKRISEEGLGSFLAVLKVFGRQESLISFPEEGYTLALDFPVRQGLFTFLDELDGIVLRYGGRIYLSKDARMKPEVLEKGYPNLEKFRSILKKYNPTDKLSSMQSERLLLTGN